MAHKKLQTYAEFWPYYLGEHSVPLCRSLHFFGTTLVFSLLAAAVITKNPWFALGMPFAGYGFAWVGHFVIEKNRPATFTYPLWSLVSDFRMWAVMASGKLWSGTNPAEQLGLTSPSASPAE